MAWVAYGERRPVEKVLDRVQRAHKDTNVAMTSDGRWFVSVGVNNNEVKFFDTNRNEQVIQTAAIVYSFTLSKDSTYVLIDTGNPGPGEEGETEKIEIWSRQDDKRIAVLVGHHRDESTILMPCFGGKQDQFFASGSNDCEVKIWHRPETEEDETVPCHTLAGHSSTVNSVTWNTVDPRMMASGSDDGTIRIWGLQEMLNQFNT